MELQALYNATDFFCPVCHIDSNENPSEVITDCIKQPDVCVWFLEIDLLISWQLIHGNNFAREKKN